MRYRIFRCPTVFFDFAMCSRSSSSLLWLLVVYLLLLRTMSPVLPTCILYPKYKVRTNSLKSRAQRNKKKTKIITHTSDCLHSHSNTRTHTARINMRYYALCKFHSNTSNWLSKIIQNKRTMEIERERNRRINKYNLSAFHRSGFWWGFKTKKRKLLWL